MFVKMECRGNKEGRKTVLMRKNTRRKYGEAIVVEIEYKRGEKKEMVMKWKGNRGN